MRNLNEQSTMLNKIYAKVQHENQVTHQQQVHDLRSQVELLLKEATKTEKCTEILRSLLFKEISCREQQISASCSTTFLWIFQDDTSPFKDWLRFSNDIFWVCGKAGYGKSTLMKFLALHDETQRHLKLRAGDFEPVIGHYFSGVPAQRFRRHHLAFCRACCSRS